MAQERKRDWRPVLRGRIYCSPGCKAGCTRKDYEAKRKQARAAAQQLGEGWKPQVWENMGWHWSLRHEQTGVEIHPVSGRRVIKRFWATTQHEETPQYTAEGASLRATLNELKKVMREERALLDRRLSLLVETT